jgi:hypothetical protein
MSLTGTCGSNPVLEATYSGSRPIRRRKPSSCETLSSRWFASIVASGAPFPHCLTRDPALRLLDVAARKAAERRRHQAVERLDGTGIGTLFADKGDALEGIEIPRAENGIVEWRSVRAYRPTFVRSELMARADQIAQRSTRRAERKAEPGARREAVGSILVDDSSFR